MPTDQGVSMSIADEIEKLDALRRRGVLTDKEFRNQKKALLSSRASGKDVDEAVDTFDPYIEQDERKGRSFFWWLIIGPFVVPLWLVFCLPGALLIWLMYMFPRDEAEAISAARRRGNLFMEVLTSLAFYATVLFTLSMF